LGCKMIVDVLLAHLPDVDELNCVELDWDLGYLNSKVLQQPKSFSPTEWIPASEEIIGRVEVSQYTGKLLYLLPNSPSYFRLNGF
jgi:hypothetical protein